MQHTTATARVVRRAESLFVTSVVAVVLATACAPLGSGSETVERPDFATEALVLGDGTTGVLGVSQRADDRVPARIVEPAPVGSESLLPPSTTSPPPVAPAAPAVPNTSVPTPSPAPTQPLGTQPSETQVPATAAPSVRQQGIVIPPLGPNAARALERLTDPRSRDVAGRALGLISFDWRNGLPGWELRFLDGRSGFRGLTYPDTQVIEVFVRAGDSPEELAHVVAHEMGHAVDVSRLTDADRAVWAAARGYGSRAPWWVGSGGADFASGSGDFAESFAWWQSSGGRWFGDLAGPPNALQVALLSQLTYAR